MSKSLTFFMLGLRSSADFFQNNFFKKVFEEHCQTAKSLVPFQDQCSVGPDLGPNCLQRLSADDKDLSIRNE